RKASDDDRLQAARNYGKALEERLQQAEDRVNPLEAQLNTFEQRSRTAQVNTEKLSKQKQDLEDNVRSLTSKCDEATEKLHSSEIECAKLREELRTKIEAEKRSENTRTSNRHAGSDTAFATTIALDALKKNLKSADQKAQRLQAELDGMPRLLCKLLKKYVSFPRTPFGATQPVIRSTLKLVPWVPVRTGGCVWSAMTLLAIVWW
ncbi:unnamed protein product, partial [Tilletia caries]